MTPIFVTIGYGHEHPVYKYCKDLWSAYARNFPEYNFVFHRLSNELNFNEVKNINSELLIDEYDFSKTKNKYLISEEQGYPKNIARWIKLFNYLIVQCDRPFWLYAPTVTSVIDFRLLKLIINDLECRNIYAGGPLITEIPKNNFLNLPDNKLFRMISGSGFLISSDLINLILKRANDIPHFFPDDVWMSLTLRDIPRISLMRCDITQKYNMDFSSLDLVNQFIAKARLDGHFHFRVKTARFDSNFLPDLSSQYHDPMLINHIMLHILSNKINENDFLVKYNNFRLLNSDSNDFRLNSISS